MSAQSRQCAGAADEIEIVEDDGGRYVTRSRRSTISSAAAASSREGLCELVARLDRGPGLVA